jgi:peptidyl-tRNA hydrolase
LNKKWDPRDLKPQSYDFRDFLNLFNQKLIKLIEKQKIVGLGNLVYPNTRHSVGIAFVERLAKRLGMVPPSWPWLVSLVCSRTTRTTHMHMIYTDMKFVRDKTVMGFVASREGLVLVQPTTFMNLNGKTVLRAMRKFDVDAQDVTVVHDDVETALGKIGVRLGGGARYA